MPLILGIVFLAVGISLLVAWWSAAFVAALQVVIVLTLLFFGLLLALVGYSSTKATRDFKNADANDPTMKGKSPSNPPVSGNEATDV